MAVQQKKPPLSRNRNPKSRPLRKPEQRHAQEREALMQAMSAMLSQATGGDASESVRRYGSPMDAYNMKRRGKLDMEPPSPLDAKIAQEGGGIQLAPGASMTGRRVLPGVMPQRSSDEEAAMRNAQPQWMRSVTDFLQPGQDFVDEYIGQEALMPGPSMLQLGGPVGKALIPAAGRALAPAAGKSLAKRAGTSIATKGKALIPSAGKIGGLAETAGTQVAKRYPKISVKGMKGNVPPRGPIRAGGPGQPRLGGPEPGMDINSIQKVAAALAAAQAMRRAF